MTNFNNEPRKRFLALDTSTAVLGVAVTADGELLHEINASGERNHSVHLLPIIEQALQASATAPDMIGGVAVGVGPGSYTGTRIAVTAAKTLAWAWNVPVTGVSSLHALAWGGYHAARTQRQEGAAAEPPAGETAGPDWIIPLMDARRGQAYSALFAADGDNPPQRLAPDAIRLMADWVQELDALLKTAADEGRQPGRLLFTGETGLHGSPEALAALAGAGGIEVMPYELEGRWTGFLAEAGIYEEAADIHALIPNYTQLTEAEANLRRSREGSLNK
ncbi:tRNA (adenosine(37)-N6)-threonylcarbamoyltransferase complex dimerization subunit type 1 TsaB [Paenibacillus sp. MMS20-IR301]|uniref:tRNA (adenosine(37)-N6)-threonylcarbamoyltransferase complex dimerization subunit type 1 TsaB n=1 Tax=Paenibacillus sp. MMS20-IR301 TaxID=2895946 RepID=UPI0028E26673|nr:tRNA (adenosine(37)-N6)-threonylcarbamoyltransferase complex dimerization subunit type 1 TsaB [Paenibacillus sp. MMS20-IR301]WNS41230.1 tRNA (adenosine(37)-N6)-threonylcarbamoyltransferase complex dimerization subunit type 1 TsaB [Paenibacillus sp. MMS20-IR301]